MDGTYNQTAPLKCLSKLISFWSFDLSSATDRFPLAIQGMLVEALFNLTTAFFLFGLDVVLASTVLIVKPHQTSILR